MAIFRHDSASNPSSALRLPASRRMSTAAAARLSTILEGDRAGNTPSHMPLRSSLRHSGATADRPSWQALPAHRGSDTSRSPPPSYGYVPSSSIGDDEDLTAPVEGEKLAQLRREEQERKTRSFWKAGRERKTRGGFWRLLLIVLGLLVVIGLAVGLGVGLTVGRRSSSDGGGSDRVVGGSVTPQQPPQFPIGEYSFVTSLRDQKTDCTPKPAAWRCYPYSTFAQSNVTSQSTFNWIISNTSSTYALNTTGATPSSGIPANLSISTQNNPFAISFTNESLTYINDSNNSSSPRYAFEFTMSKIVVPSPAITSNNQASQCFYNSTVFAGFLYLSAPRTFPDVQLRDNTALGGYIQWPYAVEITQTSPGGTDIPDCYETINGAIDDRIINGLEPQPESSTCLCDYRNY